MSLQFRIADQVLRVDDKRDATDAVVHKFDAFLNLVCADRFAFQRDAVRTALRFLISDRYPNLERLARENWNAHTAIQQRHDNLESYLAKMPLRDRKAVSLDLATGAGKSYVMYALAAITLAEGLVDRVLVLCPSLTIEEGLLEKFTALAGNNELAAIMKELGAVVMIPGIKRANCTTQSGEICVENIHAVYENAGSSIADSFREGKGKRTLVLNDEAHHLFNQSLKKSEWLKFLVHPDYGFRFVVNVTGTAYVDDEYFPDVVYRYGLKQAIWVTSGVPSSGDAKARVEAVFGARDDKDSPEKRRKENLALLKEVDEPGSAVEWIVSVSMLTEGWDVKNVFQIVPHESRAFNSKLLIQQVLGRGLRVPPGLDSQPLVRVNNHEKWSPAIATLLNEILEVENTLSWGYDERRKKFLFPLHNLRYEPEQKTVEVKREKAREPDVKFLPQDRKTIEYSTFSETGKFEVEIEHRNLYEIEDAVKLMRLFLREKDEVIAKAWTRKRLREFIIGKLRNARYDESFLSKENLIRLQQGFGPVFRELDREHPRMSQTAKEVVPVDLTEIPPQSFSESTLKEHGSVWYVKDEPAPFGGQEVHLWDQYQKFRKQLSEYGDDASDQAKAIGSRLNQVDLRVFKSPWNVHYASFEPERRFSDLLFENADLFDSFVKMPNQSGYAFPYSYKPVKAGKTHVANENFNPDYFIRVRSKHDILVVEVKSEGDDSNRNKAKGRDGLKHFETLNAKLEAQREPWRYHFYFLSPEDYASFFEQVRNKTFKSWKSGLMQTLA